MRRLWIAVVCVLVAAGGAGTGTGSTAVAESDEPVVLEPVGKDPGPKQDPAAVAARVAPLAQNTKKLGKQAATMIVDVESGETLYDDDGSLQLIPASTNKIPTAVAALRMMGPNKTLQTRVTRAGNDVFLIGGGDPLLASRPAKSEPGYPQYPRETSMRQLARSTAAQLKSQNTTTVALKVDDTLFDGPAWNPDWPEYYRTQGIVAPVSALIVDDGREGTSDWAPIGTDPAMAAGDTFARLLETRGVKVTGVTRGKSTDAAQEVASVSSAPIFQLVEQTLTTSDNQTAENLFRLAGRAGGFDGSFAGGSQAVGKALDQVGISAMMANFSDGSGLSRENHLTVTMLTDILRRAVRSEDGLWPISSGLAVAGVNGTLRNRFATPETSGAAGWLRGKTGTLNYVSSLAGFVQSRSGRVLVYASIGNEATSSYDAGTQIDQIIAAAADCGCPGDDR